MTNSRILSLSLFLLFVAVTVVSCGEQSFRDRIEGRWKVIYFVIENPDELDPELVAETKAIAESVRYRFNRDFTYDIRSRADTKSSTGTWKFNSENNVLILNMEGRDITRSKIEWIEDDELILKTEMGEIGDVQLTLKKQD